MPIRTSNIKCADCGVITNDAFIDTRKQRTVDDNGDTVWVDTKEIDPCGSCGSRNVAETYEGAPPPTKKPEGFEEIRTVDPGTGHEVTVSSKAQLNAMKAAHAQALGRDPSDFDVEVLGEGEYRQRAQDRKAKLFQTRKRLGWRTDNIRD